MTANKTAPQILVIKLSALGDFIQALGPMKAIRNHHKDAKITILTTKAFEKFAHDCGYFDDVWLDDRPKLLNVGGWLKLRQQLNSKNFERVYDLQNSDRTSIYFRLFKSAHRPEWVGTAPGASHRNTSAKRTMGHAFQGHKQTLGLAGIKNIENDPLDWMDADLSGFELRNPYILLVPGSAPSRPEKRWPAEHYAQLANTLSNNGYQPVILGTTQESEATTIIANACPKALDLTGRTTLQQIAALGRNANAAIGNDTGPIHLIAATSCRCLVLFSQHSCTLKHAPQGKNVEIITVSNLNELDSTQVLEKLNLQKPGQIA